MDGVLAYAQRGLPYGGLKKDEVTQSGALCGPEF